jgi:hypothetical protein
VRSNSIFECKILFKIEHRARPFLLLAAAVAVVERVVGWAGDAIELARGIVMHRCELCGAVLVLVVVQGWGAGVGCGGWEGVATVGAAGGGGGGGATALGGGNAAILDVAST